MGLLFGTRPFDFSDFFKLIMSGDIDFSNLNYIDVMKKSVDAGLKHIEITGDLPMVLPGILTSDEIEKMVEFKEKEKITYSVHLPLWGMEPAAFSEDIRNGSIEAFVKSVELTKPLDPYCWVLHPTGKLTVEFLDMNLPNFARDLMIQQFVSHSEGSIKKLLERTKIPSRKIAVETIEFPFESMVEMIKNLDLSICLDTGHVLAGYSGKINVLDFVDSFYNRIIELHLHDGKYPRIDHKPLGTNELPAVELLTKLNKKKFKGPLVYELTFEEVTKSMNFIKEKIPNVL